MEIDVKVKRHIEKIISRLECRKDFECYKSGFENLTEVKYLKTGNLLECLGENPQNCEFAIPFGGAYFCKCPLRHYIAKNLKK